MNRQVNVTKRVKVPQGLRYCPVVLSANGRIRPDWVLAKGREERHPEGAYYLEWREGTKRTRISVGSDPATATARRMQKEAELNAKNNGIEVVPVVPPNGNNGHRSLAAAVAEFLEETKLTKKPKTLAAYDGHVVKNIPSLDYCETHATPITGHAAQRLIETADSVQGLNFGNGHYGLWIQHENGNQSTTISLGAYGDRFYFPKKVNDGVVEDSAEGQWTLGAALCVAFHNGYKVIEERQGANIDNPLSGELIYSHTF